MATEPFTKEQQRVLLETPKDEDVALKPDGICYMEGVWYRRRLTLAFGAGAWALKPTGPHRTVGNIIEWPGALYILGRWVAEAVGGQATSSWMNHADSIQGAKTDCLSKCCGHGLTMASELWNKEWRESWMNKYAKKEWEPPKGDKKGRWVWSLKEKREGRDANLMGDPSTELATEASIVPPASRGGTPTPNSVGLPASETTPTNAGAATTSSQGSASDTGEAAPQETYDNILGLFKKHKFTKLSSVTFLKKFNVEKVTALTARQARACEALLDVYLDSDAYQAAMQEMREDGVLK